MTPAPAMDAGASLQQQAERFGYPLWDGTALDGLQPDFGVIGYPECLHHVAVVGSYPAGGPAGQRYLLLSDPFDGSIEDRVCRRLAVQTVLMPREQLQAWLQQQEDALRAMDGFALSRADEGAEEVAAVITLDSIRADPSDVVRLVNSTIYDALKLRASDIHLECDGTCLQVLYRIDGVLNHITEVAGREMAEQVVSRIKVMADLDISERRIPQDGRFKARVNQRDIDFRVSVMPSLFGEDAVLRLLDRQALSAHGSSLTLESLGLPAAAIVAIRRLAQKPHGMLLTTGPTGSGKTTTLYAAITEINHRRDKIITIEDPVEYRLPGVLQIPVNEKKGLSFARGLRSILRHDPDRIMVGEIRDGETAQIAVQAALTGHLVFTSVHANSAFDVLGRFIHMGVDAYSLGAALNGIVAQRLVRMACPHCATEQAPEPELMAAAGIGAGGMHDWHPVRANGCERCRHTGYQGRRAAAEVLVLDDRLREMIASRTSVAALREYAAQQGMPVLRDTICQWVASGETTLEELLRVAG